MSEALVDIQVVQFAWRNHAECMFARIQTVTSIRKTFGFGRLRFPGRRGTLLAPKRARLSTQTRNGESYDESRTLDSRPGPPGSRDHGPHVCICCWLRESLKGASMIVLAAIVTLLLFVYLLAALLRPEWF